MVINGTVIAGFYHELTLTIADLHNVAGGFSNEAAVTQNVNSAHVTATYQANFNPRNFVTSSPGGNSANNSLLVQYLQSGTVGAMRLGNLFAAGGNVIIDAKNVAGSGQLEAHGGPPITVNNNSKDSPTDDSRRGSVHLSPTRPKISGFPDPRTPPPNNSYSPPLEPPSPPGKRLPYMKREIGRAHV